MKERAKEIVAFLAGALFMGLLWLAFRGPTTVVNFAPPEGERPAVRPYQERWHPDYSTSSEGLGR